MIQTTPNILKSYGKKLSKPQYNHFCNYIEGLSVCEKPTINRISHLYDKDRSSMNRFLTESPWKISDLKPIFQKQVINQTKSDSCLLIDDSISHRPYANKVEKANYHYDHTNNKQSLGYCIVTAAIHSQSNVLPYDTVPYYREVDCDDIEFKTKNTITSEIIESTKNSSKVKTIIFDTWFSNNQVINACKDANKNYITQIKSNRNVTINQHKNAVRAFVKDINDWHEFEHKGDKFRIFATSAFISKIGSVHLIFSEMYNKKSKKWGSTNYLISNQMNVDSREIIKDYLIRWGIECFHREAKQNIGFEGYFYQKNRGIEKHLFLAMLAYTFLLLKNFKNESKTIGKLCEDEKMQVIGRAFDEIQENPNMRECILRGLVKARV